MPNLHSNAHAPIGPTNIGSTRIARVLTGAPELDDATVEQLHDAVGEYVRLQKVIGTTPECIIARVKGIVQACCPAGVPLSDRNALLSSAFEWCLREFYGKQEDAELTEKALRPHHGSERAVRR